MSTWNEVRVTRLTPEARAKLRRKRQRRDRFFMALIVLYVLVLIAFTVWVSIAWCLVGGISQIVTAAQAHPVDQSGIAWGVIRVFGAAGSWLLAAILGYAGVKYLAEKA